MSESRPTITFVYSPDYDWVQIYAGDTCIQMGHQSEARNLLRKLGFHVRTMETTQEFAEAGVWPDDFSKFPAEHLRYDGE